MPWNNDIYYYKIGTLNAIAKGYSSLYTDGLLLNLGNDDSGDDSQKDKRIKSHKVKECGQVYNRILLQGIAEYKADFDNALSSIGKGDWNGLTSPKFKDYRYFGRLQRAIIAVILGITDREMEAWGFWDVRKYRHMAYKRMAVFLNEEKITNKC